MSQSYVPAAALWRLPVEKPAPAVEFLQRRGGGVMDLIAHFWERLAQTPPLQRGELHLVAAGPGGEADCCKYQDFYSNGVDPAQLTGAMLYVPKAHRADVLALTPETAAAFAGYIAQVGALPAEEAGKEPRVAIDFLTGQADGIQAMVPHLLPLVHKRAPVRQVVNVVMQLPPEAAAAADAQVRVARDADIPILNRWRRLYKEERGILFDADVDAWVESRRVFVYEDQGQIVAVAKFDLELSRLIEIGGVFTFPEFRKQGFGGKLVGDLAVRIRAAGKIPTLQVDRENAPALALYERMGWKRMGSLARVWLTG